jgi:hypothetical protein
MFPCFCNIRQFGDKLTHIKPWTGAKYKDMVKVWLAALGAFLERVSHPI